jgi:transposase
VSACKGAASYDEIAQKTGMKLLTVKQRCESYRKKGVELPSFSAKRGGKPIDVAALNAILHSQD